VCISAETATSCDADSLPLPPPSCDGRAATIIAPETGGALAGTSGDDVIVGSDNLDLIDGLGGNDVICGRAGSDTVVGGEGDDRIFAGEDYAYPEGGFVGDTVEPGPGDDVVDLGTDARLAAGDGMDTLSYAASATGITAHLSPVGQTFTVTGEGTDFVTTHVPFQLWGSELADVITGSDGDDRIVPGGGDDVVDGGAGDDQIEDGCPFTGCQPLDHDVLLGGEGADILATGIGRDDLDGGPGDDVLSVTSREGAGTVKGGVGDDRLRVFVRGAATHGHVDGGAGADVLDVIAYNLNEGRGRVVVDAAVGRLGSVLLGDLVTFTGIEAYALDAYNTGTERRPLVFRFLGSASSERLSVTRYAVSVLRASMRGGDDLVRGSRQDDVVDGGAGTDTVHALRGDDRCIDVEVARGCEVLSP
jgi:Ca2+-binding RTX toxin-like protein